MLNWILAAIVLLLIYYFYIPIPRDATEPWKLRLTATVSKLQGDLVLLYSVLMKKPPHVAMRAQFERLMSFLVFFQPRIDGIEETQEHFDGIFMRIYRPTTNMSKTTDLPGIVYIHGGGWNIFSTKIYSYFTKFLCRQTNAVVVSIEYRLAPEHVFPAAFDDCFNATKYFLMNALQYNVDQNKIGVVGDSAGGNLAMAVALKLSGEAGRNIPKLAFEVLIYPCLQALDFNLASFRENNIDRHTHCPLTKNSMILFNNFYALGDYSNFMAFVNNKHLTIETKRKYRNRVDPSILQGKYITDTLLDMVETDNKELANKLSDIILNPYFAPLMTSDEELSKLPNTYLLTCEFDPLRDEGLILHERMKRINHPVEHLHLPGSEHGTLLFPYYKEYRRSVSKIAYYIQMVTK